MFDEIKKYKNYGHFFFKRGGNLKQVSKSVPDLPGVYYIVRLFKGKIELVYIDKSGTYRPLRVSSAGHRLLIADHLTLAKEARSK